MERTRKTRRRNWLASTSVAMEHPEQMLVPRSIRQKMDQPLPRKRIQRIPKNRAKPNQCKNGLGLPQQLHNEKNQRPQTNSGSVSCARTHASRRPRRKRKPLPKPLRLVNNPRKPLLSIPTRLQKTRKKQRKKPRHPSNTPNHSTQKTH